MRLNKTPSDSYIESTFVTEALERESILSDLKTEDKHGIQVSPTEGQMLKFFSQMIGAKKIVEIGTLFGYSTSWFLESVGMDGQVWSLEKEEVHFKKASQHLNKYIQSKNLEILLGDALTNLKAIERNAPFDLVFIDANKAGYMDYFNWANLFLKPGGLIIADNTFLFGEVFKAEAPENNKKAWKVMRELNETLAKHPNYISTLIPTKEGMTVAMKKL